MVFKRRTKRSWLQWLSEGFWPKSGWGRALIYIQHRLRRLPDAPHRIARGIFAGVFISFTPLFGLHFFFAAGIAWLMRGNIIAALIATVVGNPITFPFIAALSVELGNWILGHGGEMTPLQIAAAFGQAGAELSANFWALFDADTPARWERLHRFFHRVYWPYMIGGLIPGIIAGLVGYYLSLPVIGAYQKLRKKRLADRFEKQRAARAEARARAAAAGGDDGSGRH
ncbi:MAG: DUF2062 domain-containing protein [Paracoccaceae bacterium]|nr:MAG: DUF2062 domain-containing protein [Paracoccaceae bacterium]